MLASKKGFTLIELLIVIAIIGILASIIVVNLTTARGKARDARRKSDMDSIRNALEMYNNKNGRYPDTLNAWQWSTQSQPWIHDENATPIELVPEYISTLPIDPRNTSSNLYYYRTNTGGTEYKLMSRGMESTEGKNWARNDGGRADATINRNWCPPIDTGSCPATSYCACDFELFTPGGFW